MIHVRRCAVWALTLFALAAPARAGVLVSNFLELTQLLITPASGTVDVITPWSTSAYAEAQQSNEGFVAESNTVINGSSSADAARTYATAASVAALSWATAYSVTIPTGGFSAEALGRGTIIGAFQILGGSDPVQVTIAATLAGSASVTNTAPGDFGRSDVSYTFRLDGKQEQAFNASVVISGAGSLPASYGFPLTNTVLLTPGTVYNFTAEVSAEASGMSAVPEPWSAPLLAAALGLLASRRRRAAL